MCFPRMSLSGHRVSTQSACQHVWSRGSQGASLVAFPDREPLHRSSSNKIHKKAGHGFQTHTPLPAGMLPGSTASVTKPGNHPRSPMASAASVVPDPWKRGGPAWAAQRLIALRPCVKRAACRNNVDSMSSKKFFKCQITYMYIGYVEDKFCDTSSTGDLWRMELEDRRKTFTFYFMSSVLCECFTY